MEGGGGATDGRPEAHEFHFDRSANRIFPLPPHNGLERDFNDITSSISTGLKRVVENRIGFKFLPRLRRETYNHPPSEYWFFRNIDLDEKDLSGFRGDVVRVQVWMPGWNCRKKLVELDDRRLLINGDACFWSLSGGLNGWILRLWRSVLEDDLKFLVTCLTTWKFVQLLILSNNVWWLVNFNRE